MENNQNIEANCGIKPSDVQDIIIGNDPNFVFTNDPNFTTTILYDIEGNVINVNSWIECSHYVRGGWSSNINISTCLLYTSPSPRDGLLARMPSSA